MQIRNHLVLLFAGGLVAALFLGSCQPEEIENPYTVPGTDATDSTATEELVYAGLPGIQDRIFRPTCANAGCHDGTFEPDLRTLTSSYNTLVDHPIIKNSPDNRYSHRVVPGDIAASQLVARLTTDIDGESGIMPLVIDPDSDYDRNREVYIEWIKRWIAEGAKLQD